MRPLDWLKHRDKAKALVLMCQHKLAIGSGNRRLRFLDHDQGRKYENRPRFLTTTRAGERRSDAGYDLAKYHDSQGHETGAASATPAEQRKVWDAYYEPATMLSQENPQGDDLVRWRYQRYMHDYLGCIRSWM